MVVRGNRTRLNLWLDLVLVIVFAVVLEFRFTGLRLHELLGVAFGGGLIIHVILHLDWVWAITRSFFRTLLHETRLNYVLNLILFLDAFVMVLSGVLISRTLGLNISTGRVLGLSWERVHIVSSELSLVIIALHVAMHWKWLGTHLKRSLLGRNRSHAAQAEIATPSEG